MNRTRTLVAAGALTLALAVPMAPAATATISPLGSNPTVGLAGDRTLVGFRLDRPESARSLGEVKGLSGDTALVGLDRRPADGKLYAVGNKGGVYTVTLPTQHLLWKKAPTATLVNRLTVALSGTSFGVDFNPAADRLRVISDTGQNLRHDVNAGGVTIADGTLAYAPATTPATGVTAAAYTNNDTDAATATTLFDIDTRNRGWATLTVAVEVSGVTATAGVVPHTWGVEVRLTASGFAAGDRYRVVVLGEDGRTYPAGEFVGTGARPMVCNLNSSVLRADAAGFEVLDGAGTVLAQSTFPAAPGA
ncbi:DUF4394 domain-containing protein [Phycicoccus sp. HDW14]|uniref:DUF4394 domain-containing protein n=1 Tax=Phycicoccus sp. HDW14 TaxID=2714941 RepID=UPI00197C2A41|nr:DUF4394 domain-containing protein [Phycicoccus sp. HDW14]